jgi:4-hydroxyproline epimerase
VQRLEVIDSHTGGEPTRVIVSGAPDLVGATTAERLRLLRERHDWLRTATVTEPRGSDVMVGALLLPPERDSSVVGVVFFNNVGYLGMCGHATIGLVRTLLHLGWELPSTFGIDTPVGEVRAYLRDDGRIGFENVPSYRFREGVSVQVPSGPVAGDVAYGGNWFFLTGAPHEIDLRNVDALTAYAAEVRRALAAEGIVGERGEEIDHIELTSPPCDGGDGRNFVLCPGFAYDRSPCGTGTSAKLACLAAAGKLASGEVWRQEGILGSVFEGTYRHGEEGRVVPTIVGDAHVTAEATLLIDPADPFGYGVRPPRR